MLRIFIRKGQMKRCAWQLRTLRGFSALLLSFQILFSLQQSQWYRSQNVHSFAQNSSTRSHLTESKPRVPAMAYQALCCCAPSRPPSLPTPVFVVLSSSTSLYPFALAHLAPARCLLPVWNVPWIFTWLVPSSLFSICSHALFQWVFPLLPSSSLLMPSPSWPCIPYLTSLLYFCDMAMITIWHITYTISLVYSVFFC